MFVSGVKGERVHRSHIRQPIDKAQNVPRRDVDAIAPRPVSAGPKADAREERRALERVTPRLAYSKRTGEHRRGRRDVGEDLVKQLIIELVEVSGTFPDPALADLRALDDRRLLVLRKRCLDALECHSASADCLDQDCLQCGAGAAREKNLDGSDARSA